MQYTEGKEEINIIAVDPESTDMVPGNTHKRRLLDVIDGSERVKVKYIPGNWLPCPDALSRAVDTKSGTSDCDQRLQDETEAAVDSVIETLPLNDKRLEQIRKHTLEDPVMADLKRHILQGWPSSKEMCSQEKACFWNIRAELSVADDLILKGSKLVIPRTLRGEILSQIHAVHMGIEKCR